MTKDDEQTINLQMPNARMLYEVQEIAKLVQENDYTACYQRLTTTLAVMEVLENTRKAAGIYFTDEK